jgi:hypothetical protein
MIKTDQFVNRKIKFFKIIEIPSTEKRAQYKERFRSLSFEFRCLEFVMIRLYVIYFTKSDCHTSYRYAIAPII